MVILMVDVVVVVLQGGGECQVSGGEEVLDADTELNRGDLSVQIETQCWTLFRSLWWSVN